MARNNEPALGRKTPLLICSMRTEIPYPCIGSKARVFRTSMSKVPCITSVVLSGIKVLSSYWHPSGAYACPTGCQEEKTLNFIRKRPQNSSWRGTVREVGTQSGREEKREARAGSVASRVE